MANVCSLKIGGPAGFGIMSVGLTFSKIALRSGYHVFDYTEYPSLIRGGHNVMQTVFSEDPVGAPVRHTNFLVALNQESIDFHAQEIVSGGGILYDAGEKFDIQICKSDTNIFAIPLVDLARDAGGSSVMRNTVAAGATLALLGGDIAILKNLIAEEFGDKKPEMVELNHRACQAGYDYVMSKWKDQIMPAMKPLGNQLPQIVVTGNEAMAMGAIAAGVKFVSVYPMTPTSNLMHTLAPLQEKFGFIYKQPEDEIAAINMAIGASYAGARSMVATSGGGFCLMSEGYGLAGMTEIPLVIIEGMRGSPATGLPTWNEQGDLRFVLHAHQGDFPRIVLAAGDIQEAFDLTILAFNLADKYQTPVVVLVDKNICECHMGLPVFKYEDYEVNRGKFTKEKQGKEYQRYAMSSDGISLRSVPGSGNFFITNSDEHTTVGYSTEELEIRMQQMRKRMAKLSTCMAEDMQGPQVYGPAKADLTIVSWGSNKGAILEALKRLNQKSTRAQDQKSKSVNYIHNMWMNPFPALAMKEKLSQAKVLLNIECNYTAQFAGLVRQYTGIEIKEHLLKYDGRPIYPEEIVEKVESMLSELT